MKGSSRILLAMFLVVALGLPGFVLWSRLSPSNYAAAIGNGRETIPPVREFETLLPEAYHFISYYPRGGVPIWNAEAGLHQRYLLAMKFEISFDFSRRMPRPISEPRFFLTEVQEIREPSPGRFEIRYGPNQHSFGIEDWRKLMRSDGDFSTIGIELDRDRPVPRFDAALSQRKTNAFRRIRKSP